MHYTDDPIRDAERTQLDQERWLELRPVCDYCNNYIQDDHYFEPEVGMIICDDCLRQYCVDNYKIEIGEG